MIEMDDFMKEVVYGYSSGEKNITQHITTITFISETSQDGDDGKRMYNGHMSEMSRTSIDYYDFER